MSDRWFTAVESQQVVGRVVEIDKPWTEGSRSEEAKTGIKKQLFRKVPAMEAKTAGQGDISYQELKEWNREAICARFPGAWEYYLSQRGQLSAAPQFTTVTGTPVDEADFIPRAKIAWLKETGFSTVEQIAGLSDAQI